MNVAIKYRDRIDMSVMLPRVNWRQPRNFVNAREPESPRVYDAGFSWDGELSTETRGGNSRRR